MALPVHTLAACQLNPRLGDLQANLERHLQLATEAADAGCALALFPELSLTGYALRDQVHEVALAADDAFFAPLLEISRRIDVCVGFVEVSAACLSSAWMLLKKTMRRTPLFTAAASNNRVPSTLVARICSRSCWLTCA